MDLLSKSQFVKGWQCQRMLWLDMHHPELFDDSLIEEDKARQEEGHIVGELAREVIAHGAETIEQTFDFQAMAEETETLLRARRTVCEATFLANGEVSMADIFRPCAGSQDAWEMVEVKASTHVKDYHIVDAAYQYRVATAAGYRVEKVYIAHINKDFVRGAEFDPGEPFVRAYVPETGSKKNDDAAPVATASFFILEDITERIAGILADMKTAELVSRCKALRAEPEEPDIKPGRHCNNPHTCGYQNHCMEIPQWMLGLAGMGRAKAIEAMGKGISRPEDLLAKKKAPDLQTAQLASAGRHAIVRADRLREFLGTLSLPMYFLDFETVQTAIPEYEGTSPYQQVTTQFSLHILEENGGLIHWEYLAPSKGSPLRGVAEALVEAIPEGVCSIAYNMAFEKGRIADLAAAFPDLADHLMDIHRNMRDIMAPFKGGWLYLPAMGGSYSIKKVLPALFPDDPELDYHSLEAVQNGVQAMDAFKRLKDLPADEEAHLRERLLRYCELDTYAMVKVYEAIVQYALPAPGERCSGCENLNDKDFEFWQCAAYNRFCHLVDDCGICGKANAFAMDPVPTKQHLADAV